jgi:hypothetical protein
MARRLPRNRMVGSISQSVVTPVGVALLVGGLAHFLLQLAGIFFEVPGSLFHVVAGDLPGAFFHRTLDLVLGTLNAILVHAASPVKPAALQT